MFYTNKYIVVQLLIKIQNGHFTLTEDLKLHWNPLNMKQTGPDFF